MDSFKELCVVLIPELKHHEQVDATMKKVRNAAFLRRVFRHLPTKVILGVYTALLRPVLEYCIQAWYSTTLGDMAKIESVQHMATVLVPSITIFPYEVRIASLRLFSMHGRGDLS